MSDLNLQFHNGCHTYSLIILLLLLLLMETLLIENLNDAPVWMFMGYKCQKAISGMKLVNQNNALINNLRA